MSLAYWVHDLSPFLIRFGENSGLRYYGLAYLVGFVAAGWLLHRYHRKGLTTLDLNATLDLMFYLIVGTIVGGRLGSYLLYDGWRTFAQDPLGIFKLWQSGMASHGGFLGVAVAMWLFARRKQTTFAHVADLVVTAAPVGIFFGRIANFINGELWGRPTEVAWAVIFKNTGGGPFPRHPSQLYEAVLEGLVLLSYLQFRLWRSEAIRLQPGRLAGEFLIAYALVRTIGEMFREPDAGLILGLTRGTFFSVFMVIAGVFLIVQAGRATVRAGAKSSQP